MAQGALPTQHSGRTRAQINIGPFLLGKGGSLSPTTKKRSSGQTETHRDEAVALGKSHWTCNGADRYDGKAKLEVEWSHSMMDDLGNELHLAWTHLTRLLPQRARRLGDGALREF